MKAKRLETKNILINQKNYKDLVICFIRYVHSKSIKMLSLDYHELMGMIEEYKEKNIWWTLIDIINIITSSNDITLRNIKNLSFM